MIPQVGRQREPQKRYFQERTILHDRAHPTNGSDFGSLRSQNLTLFVAIRTLLRTIEQQKNTVLYYERVGTEPEQTIPRRMENFVGDSKVMREILLTGKVKRIVDFLFGEKSVLLKDKINFKYPGGGAFKPHIDGHFYWKDKSGNNRSGWHEYGSEFINAVICLNDSTKNNGALQVAPIKQTYAVLGNNFKTITSALRGNGPGIPQEHLSKFTFETIEMKPGDVLFFDWRCAHCSDVNTSQNQRWIIYGTYNRESEGDNRHQYNLEKTASPTPDFYKMSI